MKKNDLVKGNNPGVWDVNGDLYNEVIKRHLGKNVCFGRMCLPNINHLPEEFSAKTRKEAEQKLAEVILELAKTIKERMKQISKCQSCENFTKCFQVSLLGAIRNVTKTI